MNRRFPELLLGLSVIGLIVTLLFIAAAGAQRGQRDRARKDVIDRSVAAINVAASSNLGRPMAPTTSLPPGVTVPGTLTKPTVINTPPPAVAPDANTIYWLSGIAPTITCSGSYSSGYMAYSLENGNNAYYCVAY